MVPSWVFTGYFGLTLPLSAANMLVYGCSPHSGPSLYEPVTGMPCSCGYFAARKKSGLCETIANAFESASCTAVAISDGLVWSSMTSGTNLCPCTPPSAFCKSRRASNAAGDDPSSGAPGPVTDVT